MTFHFQADAPFNQQIFHKKIQAYCRDAGRLQKELAKELGIHSKVLSRKLHGTASFTHEEVKAIVTLLAEWDAIATQAEAIELLACMGLKRTSFSQQQWKSHPLNRLEPAQDSHVEQSHQQSQPGVERSRRDTPPPILHVLPSAERPRHNLPVAVTSFIGREHEIRDVAELLASARLLTLTGAGGSGKTRLAIEVAGSLQERYHDGVRLVELAALCDPGLVLPTIANGVNIREHPGESVLATLLAYLRDKQILLILDNCEHLIAACAQAISSILRACPAIQVMATSRETLQVSGEVTYRVPSLGVPDPDRHLLPDQLAQYDAVRLFVDRARAVQPGFTLTEQNAPLVVHVCHRLDGMPLAIELATARLRSLALEQLGARLDDRFRVLTRGTRDVLPRQQTLRALIDWSYMLLSETERLLLQRLAVFAGGWTLEAAEAVCDGDGIAGPAMLDLLDQLVNKSLVLVEAHGRYRMLETIRAYALEKLAQTRAESTLRTKHLAYMIRLGTEAAPMLRGEVMAGWLARLQAEKDNINAALAWARESDASAGIRLMLTLGTLWGSMTIFTSVSSLIEDLLARCPEDSDELRSETISQALFYAYHGGNYAQAEALAQHLLLLYHKLNKPQLLAAYNSWMGMFAAARGDTIQADMCFTKALAVARTRGNPLEIAGMLLSNAVFAFNCGEYTRAHQGLDEAQQLYHQAGHRHSSIGVLNLLGRVLLAQGDIAGARTYLNESMQLRIASGFRVTLSAQFEGLAGLSIAEGNAERAATLLGIAEAQRLLYGNTCPPTERPFVHKVIAATAAALDPTTYESCRMHGMALSHEQALAYVVEWTER